MTCKFFFLKLAYKNEPQYIPFPSFSFPPTTMPTSSSARSSSPMPFGSSQSANSAVEDLGTEQQCFKRLYMNLKAQIDSGDEPIRGKKRKSGFFYKLSDVYCNSPDYLVDWLRRQKLAREYQG
jgi:hypothetical protein